jgi:uncharacterized MAPEG superfamily protein
VKGQRIVEIAVYQQNPFSRSGDTSGQANNNVCPPDATFDRRKGYYRRPTRATQVFFDPMTALACFFDALAAVIVRTAAYAASSFFFFHGFFLPKYLYPQRGFFPETVLKSAGWRRKEAISFRYSKRQMGDLGYTDPSRRHHSSFQKRIAGVMRPEAQCAAETGFIEVMGFG